MVVAAGVAVSAAAAVASSAMSSGAQSSAAGAAADANREAYAQERADLMPYMNTGNSANTALANGAGLNTADPLNSALLKPITMDEATLQQTPGYQFNLQQGLKATQNSAAARGLGVSGAALKGAAGYATGLADSTYQQQFSNAQENQNNQFNRLMQLTDLGQNSAAQVGNAGVTTAQNVGAADIAQGNAQAAGISGVGNALSGAYGNYQSAALMSGLY